MVKKNIREILVLSELKLLKFQYNISPDLLDQIIFTEMSDEQRKWSATIATEIPSSSSSIEEETAWDLFLTDSKLCLEIEVLLNKLKIEYEINDVSNVFFDNTKNFDTVMVANIYNYLDEKYTIDDILDRVNEVGLDNLNVFEKEFLKAYGKTI
jgi:hypothetical protein